MVVQDYFADSVLERSSRCAYESLVSSEHTAPHGRWPAARMQVALRSLMSPHDTHSLADYRTWGLHRYISYSRCLPQQAAEVPVRLPCWPMRAMMTPVLEHLRQGWVMGELASVMQQMSMPMNGTSLSPWSRRLCGALLPRPARHHGHNARYGQVCHHVLSCRAWLCSGRARRASESLFSCWSS